MRKEVEIYGSSFVIRLMSYVIRLMFMEGFEGYLRNIEKQPGLFLKLIT